MFLPSTAKDANDVKSTTAISCLLPFVPSDLTVRASSQLTAIMQLAPDDCRPTRIAWPSQYAPSLGEMRQHGSQAQRHWSSGRERLSCTLGIQNKVDNGWKKMAAATPSEMAQYILKRTEKERALAMYDVGATTSPWALMQASRPITPHLERGFIVLCLSTEYQLGRPWLRYIHHSIASTAPEDRRDLSRPCQWRPRGCPSP